MIHLACASDARYAPYCAAMLHSALQVSRPARVTVHFMHPDTLPETDLARLRHLVESEAGVFHALAMNSQTVALFAAHVYFPKIIWYRCFLPELIPELDRIIYLDCDTLVTSSLQPLWDMPLDGYLAAAVQNLVDEKVRTRQRELGFGDERPYFNSGVILMNLARMRAEDCTARLLDCSRTYGERSLWPDQDVLNHVLGPQTLFLHPRWNTQNSFFYWPSAREVFGTQRLQEALENPAILHFEGPPEVKPWHYLSDHPWRERYWEHLRSTPFALPQPWGRTIKNRLRRRWPVVFSLLKRLRGRMKHLI
jgi:lipopolysaccharide biosynthesis glycosyltransferase